MKIISANLNGIRSATTKGFLDWMKTTDADVVCVQELKAQAADLTDEMRNPAGYRGFFHYAEKKGYSGVGIYCRREPDRIVEGIGHPGFDSEGRFIRADFGDLSVVSVYVPSGSSSPERQEAKFEFLDEFLPVMDALRSRASALGIDIVETGHFAQILGRKASKKYLSSVAIFPFLRCQNKSRQF